MPLFVGVWLLGLAALVALGAAGSSRNWPLAVWWLGGLAVYTAAQCVPLPLSVLEALDATSARIWSDAFSLLETDRRWAPISIEPESTRLEAAKWLGYAAVWALAARFARHLGLRAALGVVWALALAVAGVSALHQYLDAKRVYGLYEPISAPFASAGPLLNPNNLAGLLNLGTLCALGWALHPRSNSRQQSLGLLSAAVLGATSLLSGSRAGAGVLLLGVVGYSGAMLLGHRRDLRGARAAGLGAALVLGAGYFWLALRSSLKADLLNDDLAKLEVVRAGAAVALEHPIVGVGRGALAPEIGRLLDVEANTETIGADVVFVHAENWAVEWLAGWGLVVGGACLLGLLWLLRPRRAWLSDATRLAAYVAILVVLAQNVLDLGLEVPGLAVPLVFVLAAATTAVSPGGASAPSSRSSPKLRSATPPRRDWPLVVLAALTFTAGGVTWAAVPRLAEFDHHRLRDVVQQAEGAASRRAAVNQALLRHPADAYIMRLGALVLLDERDPGTLRWLNQALLTQPNNGRTHLVLAEALRRLGKLKQALLVLRVGIEKHPATAAAAARWALTHAPQRAHEIIPKGALESWATMALAQHAATPQARRDWTLRAQLALPAQERDYLALANATLASLTAGQAPCDAERERCLDEVHTALDAARATGMSETSLLLPQAELLLLEARHPDAFARLSAHCPRHPDRRRCSTLMLEAAAALGERELEIAKVTYLDAHCDAAEACANAHRHLASLYRGQERWLMALEHAERAAQRQSSWSTWLQASELATRAGKPARARIHLDRASRLAPGDDADAKARLQSARAALLQGSAAADE